MLIFADVRPTPSRSRHQSRVQGFTLTPTRDYNNQQDVLATANNGKALAVCLRNRSSRLARGESVSPTTRPRRSTIIHHCCRYDSLNNPNIHPNSDSNLVKKRQGQYPINDATNIATNFDNFSLPKMSTDFNSKSSRSAKILSMESVHLTPMRSYNLLLSIPRRKPALSSMVPIEKKLSKRDPRILRLCSIGKIHKGCSCNENPAKAL